MRNADDVSPPTTKRTAATKKTRPDPKALNGAHDPTTVDLQRMLHALRAMRGGDFSVRLPSDQIGIMGKIADTFNEIVASNERMAHQLEHVGQVVGRDGRTK